MDVLSRLEEEHPSLGVDVDDTSSSGIPASADLPSSPAVWITGHSLGAALATYFLSYLIYTQSPLVQSSV